MQASESRQEALAQLSRSIVERALTGTLLEGRPVGELPVPHSGELMYTVPCDPGEVLPAWRAARAAVDVTGRWPVAVFDWEGLAGASSLETDPDARARTRALKEQARRSGGLEQDRRPLHDRLSIPDPHGVLVELAANRDRPLGIPGHWERQLEWELDHTARHVGSAPSLDEVEAALRGQQSLRLLDRWLLEWELAQKPYDKWPAARADHLTPFVTSGAYAVVFTPTGRPEETLAYITAYEGGLAAGGTERLMAIVRFWNERFGAELYANYQTMLQFVVSRPPATIDEAWPLADEQVLVAPCTTLLPGVPLRRHAQALVGRGEWFLHERP